MKRIFALTVGMLLLASAAFARDIQPGEIEIAGASNGGFTSTSSDGADYSVLYLGVSGAYYVIPNLGVGATFDYYGWGGDLDGSGLFIGPKAIYNFSINEALNAYVEVMVGYLSVDGGGADANGLSFGGGGGVKFFVNESVSFNAGLSLSRDSGDFDDTNLGVDFGISVFL